MILIADNKKPNWGKIRSEYIGGGVSYRSLAEKYGLSKDAIARRAKSEHWDKDRAAVRDISATQSIQKTAESISNNAVKLEEARAAAIEVARAGIERLRTLQGSKVSTRQKDNKGNPITVDFDLLNMVTALEKLQRMGGNEISAEPVKVIIDV